MHQSFATLVTLALHFVATLATINTSGDLTISAAVVSPDGYNRTASLAGGSVVGELITATTGDTLEINVVNDLDNDDMLKTTTIHWHGIFQTNTTWADGVAFVSQCPVASGDSFLYSFPTTGQAGTFWYHSHLSTQYCDGVRGPLIIYDDDDPHASLYDVDNETTVLSLFDWYHSFAETLTLPTPDSSLLNGEGIYYEDGTGSLSVVTVESGTRYRFRLINMACDSNFVFQIQDHNMTVIEVDGVNVEAYTVDEIQIFAGQRYSFVLTADQAVDNYWILFDPDVGTTGFDLNINSAILRYNGANETNPAAATVTSTNALVETSIVPLDPGVPGTATAGGVDDAINLAVAFTSDFTFTVNGVEYVPPTVPVLLQILSGAEDVSSLLPNGSIYYLPKDSSIELSVPAGVAGGPHPLHLHGHNFDVVRSAGSDTYNYDNPVRRDVVSLGAAGDNVTIRWTTDNPGPWILHCHIDWHLALGFSIVFAEDDGDWNSTITPSTAWDDLCPIYDDLDSSEL
ncbi:laccase lcc5 [Guyanagaster necrorhizus]|uniref:Laccase lcc5 n=1 Tax=Guyanagaster necrorhizus TaxID=856835 RepID=A0A9P7VTB0_9AGAR|nr:laccase lcc5 [Guyanagaster necrorhizus MCA 3950]KAG7446172.1 laccase lcc5 [Guyanagaster necrorhizus MCA 3950]